MQNKSDFKPDPGTDPDGFFFSGVAGHDSYFIRMLICTGRNMKNTGY